MSQKRIKRPFRPIEVPQEFIDDGNRSVLECSRKKVVPVQVAVLFLIRDGKPDSPVTWEPDFGDGCGLEEIEGTLLDMEPFLHAGEQLVSVMMEVKL
jgi:hypothetical protein